jgi:hypothetical protein
LPNSLEAASRLRRRAAWCRQFAKRRWLPKVAVKIEKLAHEFDWEANLIEVHGNLKTLRNADTFSLNTFYVS